MGDAVNDIKLTKVRTHKSPLPLLFLSLQLNKSEKEMRKNLSETLLMWGLLPPEMIPFSKHFTPELKKSL